MPIELIIQKFGYFAVFLGAFIEGESFLIAGGFAAYHGYLNLELVMLAAYIGSIAWDQLYFFIGHTRGRVFLEKRPRWKAKVQKVSSYIEKHQNWLILGFRFFYGTRTVIPFAYGMSGIRRGKFIVLDLLSGVIWAVSIGMGGYFFGSALNVLIGNIQRYENFILLGIVLIGLLIWLFHLRFKRGNKQKVF